MNGIVEEPLVTGPTALHEILLGHLRLMDAHSWPGIDGLTLDVVLACYARAAAAGYVPGKAELLHCHPELAAEIEAFFAAANASTTQPLEEPRSSVATTGIRAD